MTTDSRQEAPDLPVIIVFTFWFTLLLSVAGNVAATWGHLQDAVIGGLFPVLLVLAERVLHAAGRAPWWVRSLIGAVALACIVWSATHLASLAGADAGWMRWLIPIAVDALMILSGLLLVTWPSQEAPVLGLPAEEVSSLLPASPVWEAPRSVPTVSEIQEAVDAGTARWEEPPAQTSYTETVTETKTTTRRVTGGDLSELASRLREGVERGETKPTISAAKTYLGVGHAKAKEVVTLLGETA